MFHCFTNVTLCTLMKSKGLQGSVNFITTCSHTHSGLTRAMEDSYSPIPTVMLKRNIHDTKGGLEGSIAEINGHSESLCFKFQLNDKGKAKGYTLRWSNTPWKCHGHLLKVWVGQIALPQPVSHFLV